MSSVKFICLVAAQLGVAGILKVDGSPSTNAPIVLPPITVAGTNAPQSLTSPSAETAGTQEKEIPGGFTVRTAGEMKKGRASNFMDLLAGVPGLFMQSENGMEMSKVSIRGSGIESDDEPLGVEFLFDGISMDQGDGETIIVGGLVTDFVMSFYLLPIFYEWFAKQAMSSWQRAATVWTRYSAPVLRSS